MNDRHMPGRKIDLMLQELETLQKKLAFDPWAKDLLDQTIERITRVRSYAGRKCEACGGIVHELYMVHNDLWLTVMPTLKGHLHLHCLERRLGRFLTIEDFTDTAVNEMIFFGHRMNVQVVHYRELVMATAKELVTSLGGEKEIMAAVEKAAVKEMSEAIDKDMLDTMQRTRQEILAAWRRLDGAGPLGKQLVTRLLTEHLGMTLGQVMAVRRDRNNTEWEDNLMGLTEKLGLIGPDVVNYAYLTRHFPQNTKTKTPKKKRTRRRA